MPHPRTLVDSIDDEIRMELDKLNIKELVWRVMEEIFHPTNLEEIKCTLATLMEESINVSHRDEYTMVESRGCRKEDEEQQLERKDEQSGVFLEEELVLSMLHKDQDVTCSLIGAFKPSLTPTQCCSEMGLLEKSVEEAKLVIGQSLKVQSPLLSF